MKILKIIFVFAVLLLFSIPLCAQTTTNAMTELNEASGQGFYFASTVNVDSAQIKYSDGLKFRQLAEISSTYPLQYSYRVSKVTASDSLNFSAYILGCYSNPSTNANWFAVDTLFTAAVLTSTSTPLVAAGSTDLNNKRPLYLKLKIVNNGTGSKHFNIETFNLWNPKK